MPATLWRGKEYQRSPQWRRCPCWATPMPRSPSWSSPTINAHTAASTCGRRCPRSWRPMSKPARFATSLRIFRWSPIQMPKRRLKPLVVLEYRVHTGRCMVSFLTLRENGHSGDRRGRLRSSCAMQRSWDWTQRASGTASNRESLANRFVRISGRDSRPGCVERLRS